MARRRGPRSSSQCSAGNCYGAQTRSFLARKVSQAFTASGTPPAMKERLVAGVVPPCRCLRRALARPRSRIRMHAPVSRRCTEFFLPASRSRASARSCDSLRLCLIRTCRSAPHLTGLPNNRMKLTAPRGPAMSENSCCAACASRTGAAAYAWCSANAGGPAETPRLGRLGFADQRLTHDAHECLCS